MSDIEKGGPGSGRRGHTTPKKPLRYPNEDKVKRLEAELEEVDIGLDALEDREHPEHMNFDLKKELKNKQSDLIYRIRQLSP